MKYRDIIFLHVPKCAGTSLTEALTTAIDGTEYSLHCDPHHSTGREYKNSMERERYDRAMAVLCIRNPFSRAVSSYEHARRRGNGGARKLNFTEYLEKIQSMELSQIRKENPEALPQKIFLQDLPQMYWIINYEWIQEDWLLLLKSLGLPESQLPQRNKGKYKPGEHYLNNKESAALIYKIYKDDLLIWNNNMRSRPWRIGK